VALQHGLVERHDTAFVFGRERLVEMLVVGELVHEGEEEGDEISVPDVQVDVLILLGLEERDGVDLEFAERGAVEGVQDAVQEAAEEFFIEPRDELCDLLLGNGGGQVDVPGGQAGEGIRVA
jgi:hypothetical protein